MILIFWKKYKGPLDKNDDIKEDLNIKLDSFKLKNKIDVSDNDLSDNYEILSDFESSKED